jgi:uncharacterized membrane protein
MAWLYGLTIASASVWLAGIAAAPLLLARGSKISILLYGLFSPLCHQKPERCFFLAGFPLAVCARCTGVYAGAWLGLAVRPFVRALSDLRPPRIAAFLALSFPLALDGAGNILGAWNSPPLVRFVSGLLGGLLLPFFFLAGIGALFAPRAKKK